jgi:hypothetical protein
MSNRPRPAFVRPLLLLAVAGAGCVRKTQSTLPPPPPIAADSQTNVPADPQARATDLSAAADRFGDTVRRLPGKSEAEHREVVRQALGELGRILPLLAGPDPGGAFEQRTRTIESARTRLGGDSTTTAAVEPAIDEGLRAAAGALRDVARAKYAGHQQIAQSLDELDKTVAELDVARGGPHRAVVTDAFRQTADVIHAMSDALAASKPAPAAGPTTRPSAA